MDGVLVWQSLSHNDLRGRFFKPYSEGTSPPAPFKFRTIEHFFTESNQFTFRGLHFQGLPHDANKIITIVKGSAIDFLLDLRPHSPTFGCLQIQELDSNSSTSVFIPVGIAHGYLAKENGTIISYRQDRVFCEFCDSGLNVQILASFIPYEINKLNRSVKDRELPSDFNFEDNSRCER